MKFLLYGDWEARGHGAWCYVETLRDMGHHVACVSDFIHLERYMRMPLRAVRKLLGRPLELHRRQHVQALIDLARRERPDVVIILKGIHIAYADVAELQRLGAWVCIINHDDFFSQNPSNTSDHQRGALPKYDQVFVTRAVNVAEVTPRNPAVEFLAFAYYPRIHHIVEVPDTERDQWCVDVGFVGTWEEERARLLEHLVRSVPARYGIWGAQWERVAHDSPLRPLIRANDIRLDDMAKALRGAQISLGFLRKANRDLYTQRTFEIPACGGLFLAERTEPHTTYYREGIEAEFFDPADPDELTGKVRALLADPARRAAMREAGHAALMRQAHTYRDRMTQLIAAYTRARG